MHPDDDDPERPRELRLEGGLLALAVGALLALLVGAFQLGRVVERWNAPARESASSSEAPGGAERDSADATEKLTFFDTLSGGGKEAEPARQAQSKPAVGAPPPAHTAPGPWFVQVFVGRDRQAAEDVVRSLREKQYPVRIDAVAEGSSGSLFKVRVGGFPTKEAADQGALRLRADGHGGTWVVRVAS
jgi:cell division septation protein DedD